MATTPTFVGVLPKPCCRAAVPDLLGKEGVVAVVLEPCLALLLAAGKELAGADIHEEYRRRP